MKHALFFILLMSMQTMNAQITWAPAGALWHYGYDAMCYYGYTQVTVEGDTLIEGIACRKMRSVTTAAYACTQIPTCCTEIVNVLNYTYADEDHVYHWNGIDFDTIYDFTLQVGDSYSVGANNLCPEGTLNVTEVGVVQINEFDLRYYDFEMESSDAMILGGRIIERIGVIHDGYLFPQPGCKLDVGGNSPFRCYYDPEFGLYSEMWGNNACDFVLSIDSPLVSNGIKLYPNPATDQLQIQSNTVIREYQLIDNTGRLVLRDKIASLNANINLSPCQPGIYIIKFLAEDGTITHNRLLIE